MKLIKKRNNVSGSVKLTLNQQYRFFVMISDLIQNGFAIRDAVEFVDTLKINAMASQQLIHRLQSGASFAEAIRPLIDEEMYYQILVSEQHGHLLDVLFEIRHLVSFRYLQRKQIKAILAYPLFLGLCLLLIIVGSQIFILPQIRQFNESSSKNGMNGFWWAMVGIGILSLCLLGLAWFRQLNKLNQVRILTQIPLLGGIYHHYYAYYLVSNLALMVKSGLDTKAIFSVVNHFDTNSLLYQLGNQLRQQIQNGTDLKLAIQKEVLLPNELNIFIEKGNVRLKLAQDLTAFAKINFQNMNQRAKQLISWLQPLMFIVIGSGILLTYLSMLMPMYHSLQGGY